MHHTIINNFKLSIVHKS